ncbi:rna-directed dna polymerase from mobile element jockey-like [Limosa lapponica baueri]|uniref:Rna-directed dna polymerase from mobile element jockey-like n=1 Tax=Limosa lapponica baueri TaxID=1758121 RepID=A0A2I0UMU7_LIMLA|nr:rna-directed dna polymerase from mobile element jockey-like [Limosa lapponica baueri]
MEQILLDAMLGHMEDRGMIQDSQHGFTRGKSCLTNLVAFYDEVTSIIGNFEIVNSSKVLSSEALEIFTRVTSAFYRLIDVSHGVYAFLKSAAILTNAHKQQTQSLPNIPKLGKQDIAPTGSRLEVSALYWIPHHDDFLVTLTKLNGRFMEKEEKHISEQLDAPIHKLKQTLLQNLEGNIETLVSVFADDTKLNGVDDTLEGRDTIQRDQDRLERWAYANLMKFSQAKCKVLHAGQGNPKHKCRLGRKWIKSSPEEKDFGCWLLRSST